MPTQKKNRSNPAVDLPLIVPGLINVEYMKDILAEPDADLTAGQLARIGDAFLVLGETLTQAAKDAISPQIEGMVGGSATAIDSNVVFKYTAPGKPTRAVNTKAVKDEYPDTPENAHLYRDQAGRSAFISITL